MNVKKIKIFVIGLLAFFSLSAIPALASANASTSSVVSYSKVKKHKNKKGEKHKKGKKHKRGHKKSHKRRTVSAVAAPAPVQGTTFVQPTPQPSQVIPNNSVPTSNGIPADYNEAYTVAYQYLKSIDTLWYSKPKLYNTLTDPSINPDKPHFSSDAANYAVNKVTEDDWNQQAAGEAGNLQDYDDDSGEIYSDLIADGFTPSQAQYGVENPGNWY